jgi:3-phosphoshikimate 1-carboxyvinyltransferase
VWLRVFGTAFPARDGRRHLGVHGRGGADGGGLVKTHLDHRIAMSSWCWARHASRGIDDGPPIDTASGFAALMNGSAPRSTA